MDGCANAIMSHNKERACNHLDRSWEVYAEVDIEMQIDVDRTW